MANVARKIERLMGAPVRIVCVVERPNVILGQRDPVEWHWLAVQVAGDWKFLGRRRTALELVALAQAKRQLAA